MNISNRATVAPYSLPNILSQDGSVARITMSVAPSMTSIQTPDVAASWSRQE